MKKTNRVITTSAAIAMLTTIIAPFGEAFAATTPTWVDNNSSATLIRQIANAYGTVNNTFTYTISANASNPAGASGAPTSASVVFNDSYATQGTVAKNTTVDFGSMQFERVGNYVYTIRETASSNASVYPVDSTNSYTAVVSVRNNADLTGYVASLYIQDKNGDKISDLSGDDSEFVFAAAPVYTNIQVKATASGNAADPNKCFDYTVNFNTADEYKLTTTSTCTNDGKVGNGDTIRLKAGDTITIGLNETAAEIPVGTTYSIVKSDTEDGYTTTIDGAEQTSSGNKTMVTTNAPTYKTANITTIDEYLNEAVDTGTIINVSIYILLALAGAAGVTYAVRKMSSKKA